MTAFFLCFVEDSMKERAYGQEEKMQEARTIDFMKSRTRKPVRQIHIARSKAIKLLQLCCRSRLLPHEGTFLVNTEH